MPFSFIQVEEQKTRKVIFLFLTLMVFYFLGFLAIYLAYSFKPVTMVSRYAIYVTEGSLSNVSPNIVALNPIREILSILLVALLAAYLHWYFSTHNMINRILQAIKAKPLDKDDLYHQTLKNIVEEASLAIGGRLSIEPFVINSHYLNAFSASDFKKRCIVGITEGLLIKLNRNQLESVVAHEVSHLVWGDSLLSTVSTSLAGIFSALFKNFKMNSSGNIRLVFLRTIIGLFYLLTKLLNTWISREKEYRADATAVRLTRNPLSLAEALFLISRGWRGAYLPSAGLEAIFIVNPQPQQLDEKEGLIADLFSTHPPINKRMNILLDMAHSNLRLLESSAKERLPVKEEILIALPAVPKQWYVSNESQWQGPFDLNQLAKLAWLKPDSWIKGNGEEKIKPAYEYRELNEIFKGNAPASSGNSGCPICHQGLENVYYEGIPISRCRFCGGHLIKTEQLPRMIARREIAFSEEVKRLTKVMQSFAYRQEQMKKQFNQGVESLLACSSCGRKMIRKMYPGLLPCLLELDICSACDSIWLDKNELEVIQYITEK